MRAFIAEKMSGKECGQHPAGAAAGCDTCVPALAKNTVKNAVATLRAILYQAQVDELIPANPSARSGKLFDLRQDKRKDVAVLEPTELARVLQTATKRYTDHVIAIQTLRYTGMREGELLGLQSANFDCERVTVELRRTVSLAGYSVSCRTGGRGSTSSSGRRRNPRLQTSRSPPWSGAGSVQPAPGTT